VRIKNGYSLKITNFANAGQDIFPQKRVRHAWHTLLGCYKTNGLVLLVSLREGVSRAKAHEQQGTAAERSNRKMRLPIPFSIIKICVCAICIATYTVLTVARQKQTSFIVSHLLVRKRTTTEKAAT